MLSLILNDHQYDVPVVGGFPDDVIHLPESLRTVKYVGRQQNTLIYFVASDIAKAAVGYTIRVELLQGDEHCTRWCQATPSSMKAEEYRACVGVGRLGFEQTMFFRGIGRPYRATKV